ncbi:peptidoglycan-binding protein LysM [Formosa sp. Hel1_33_131]|uniref:T9SS type A sorting domain-containing protein n=1 Tax=Formosa sp. Hel1_33_131 TaxID=1336794 RepID=UPI000865592C|nr:right-handed parallel beta-helix repeat-containing protein [Formosa sp. Hel1_33_131]AOR27364.1 peptidoglycan-binding protein LysM [Formosa sp. Hel1_33_131]
MKKSAYLKMTTICFLIFVSNSIQAQYESSILFHNNSDQLVYVSDTDGNHIPDFSYVGYKNGEEALPNVAVVRQISPVAGDNTAHIQAAIDEVEALSLNANGHRGTLLLSPGEYSVSGELIINSSGVVLRGSGDGEDAALNTIIIGAGNIPDERTLIRIGTNNKSGFGGQVAGTRQDIVSPYIPAGSRTIEVADASVYNIGDNIIIKHPSTAAWIEAVDNGGVGTDAPWEPNTINLVFNRHITNIEGNKIQVATPIYDVLDRSLSQSYVYTYNGNSQLKECGIENLRIFVESSGVTGRDHVKVGINMIGVDNSWVQGVTILRVSDQGVKFDEATRCSVIDTKVLDMHGPISGGWRYNFEVTDFCNNILFENCVASNGRHTFVANGASDVNGIVFTNCSSSGDYTRSESHRRWGQGILWDNITWTNTNTTGGILGLHNRGSYGTGHGWTVTNGVAWNIDAPSNQIAIQKPPIGQNYAVGCDATVNGDGPFDHPAGYIEGTGEDLLIQSLYLAQLEDRTTHGILPDTPGRLFPYNYVFTDSEHYLELTWHDVSMEEDNYILERSPDGVNFQTIATLPADTETYTDTDLQQANYFYRLKATNTIGTSPASNTIQTNDFYAETYNIYYVKVDGDGSDGLTEATAFTTINTAVQTASNGDTIILVGALNQSGVLEIDKSLSFKGQSDAVVTATDRMFNISAGGLSISFEDITFQNVTTTLQGAVFNLTQASDLIITDCVFENNTSSANGGAILAGSTGTLTISGSLFNNNSGSRGGAIAVTTIGRQLVMSNCTFVNNIATGNDGGAIYLGGANENSSITNTTIFNNTVINATLNQSKGGGIRLEGDRPFTISNSLIYGNFVDNGSETAVSNIGVTPNTVVSLTNSITNNIQPALDAASGDVFATSIIDADLSASNLMFNAATGFVEYSAVASTENSPIDFGSDGNDAGSWDSGLVLSLDGMLKSKVSIYVNHTFKTIEINHDLDEPLSVELFNILGSRIMDVKNSAKTQSLDVSSLKTGVYILLGKSSGTSFSKKILIY